MRYFLTIVALLATASCVANRNPLPTPAALATATKHCADVLTASGAQAWSECKRRGELPLYNGTRDADLQRILMDADVALAGQYDAGQITGDQWDLEIDRIGLQAMAVVGQRSASDSADRAARQARWNAIRPRYCYSAGSSTYCY